MGASADGSLTCNVKVVEADIVQLEILCPRADDAVRGSLISQEVCVV